MAGWIYDPNLKPPSPERLCEALFANYAPMRTLGLDRLRFDSKRERKSTAWTC
jgi:hypothetical protein